MQQIFLDLWPLYKATPLGIIWLPVCCLWRSISHCWLLISISSNQTLLFRSSSLYDPTNFLLSLLCFSVATASTEHPISLLAGRNSLRFHWECDGLRVCACVSAPLACLASCQRLNNTQAVWFSSNKWADYQLHNALMWYIPLVSFKIRHEFTRSGLVTLQNHHRCSNIAFSVTPLFSFAVSLCLVYWSSITAVYSLLIVWYWLWDLFMCYSFNVAERLCDGCVLEDTFVVSLKVTWIQL